MLGFDNLQINIICQAKALLCFKIVYEIVYLTPQGAKSVQFI